MAHASSQTIAEITTLLADFQAQKAECESKLRGIVRIIEGFETFLNQEGDSTEDSPVLGSYGGKTPGLSASTERGLSSPSNSVSGESDGWTEKLRGLTQIQALVELAISGKGKVRVTDATEILVSAGLAKGKRKNVPSHIYHLLSRSDRFERVAPGTFSLADATEEPSLFSGHAKSSQLPGSNFETTHGWPK